MPKNSLNVSLKGADDIFSTEESRQEQQREQVQQIPIGELFPFKNHPFKVRMDQEMIRLSASVEKYGIINPLIVRPIPDGVYEIISGHRRKAAAEKCIAVGMNAHLAKPLDIEKVEQTICKQLRDAKMTDIE